jgi:hypothetical protein
MIRMGPISNIKIFIVIMNFCCCSMRQRRHRTVPAGTWEIPPLDDRPHPESNRFRTHPATDLSARSGRRAARGASDCTHGAERAISSVADSRPSGPVTPPSSRTRPGPGRRLLLRASASTHQRNLMRGILAELDGVLAWPPRIARELAAVRDGPHSPRILLTGCAPGNWLGEHRIPGGGPVAVPSEMPNILAGNQDRVDADRG